MDFSTFADAAFLGILEGLTEFLPVSSTGHLILAVDILGLSTPPGKVFEIVIQLGAILAICWHYRLRLFQAVVQAPTDPVQRRFISNIVLAFLPAAVLGVMFHSVIKEVLFDPLVVAVMLIVGGIAILLIEKYRPEAQVYAPEEMSWKKALQIGFCQALAMIPGTSRSGATIMGAMLLKVDRKTATEFSFFLAIPTMLGATVYDSYKNWALIDQSAMAMIAVGFIAAFLAGLVVVRSLIAFISRHGFVPFAWYRIGFGSLMLVLLLT
jgi:undecaprenyl-diphosphatase